ncbi:MAG: ribonuclease R [Eubacteriaceae bacterium]|jgi:ribonuclease R|nr:ribonuclease R [Eubacteriaceae bacterium]
MAKKNKKHMPPKTGVIHKHKRGFGFVTPEDEDGSLGDIFVPGKSMNGAMNGDIVEVNLIPEYLWEQSREGIVTRIISRSVEEVVGTFEKNKKFGFVVPDDRKQNDDIFIKKKDFGGAKRGDKVVAKIVKYPGKHDSAEGRIIQIISHAGEPGGDIKGLIRQYNVPAEFPKKVIQEAKALEAQGVRRSDIAARKDLRGKTIFTIDGADSKDFDDAVSVEKLENGDYLLGVHIADVSHYVKENGSLDREAFGRGNSIYLVDQVIPMLPEMLSNGICSLNPGVDRLTLSVDMEITPAGDVVRQEIYESVIRSCERMVYTDVSDILEKNDRALIEKYADIYQDILMMDELASVLAKKKDARGSLDFDIEESEITLDSSGVAVGIGAAERRTANKMIEEFMLLANETVAREYNEKGAPFVYRVHDKPSRDKMEEFQTFLQGVGIGLNGSPESITPKQLHEVLEKVSGHTYENVVSSVMLRSMQKAIYNTECRGHFGLALDYYCHFTSPIRRYPDLMIHRIIKAYLHGEVDQKAFRNFRKKAKEAAEHSSETERTAIDLERDVEKLKKCEYMSYHVGEEYDGIVSGVTNYGIYVELPNTVEGMIRLTDLNDDYYEFEPQHYRLIGRRTNRIFALGDEMRIKVSAVNIEEREIDFIMI